MEGSYIKCPRGTEDVDVWRTQLAFSNGPWRLEKEKNMK